MPIPLPNLDNRRWADLVEEGRAQIVRYAPQWTDHNLDDPGITLIDLYAWLAEMTAYRMNRVPPRHRLKFVELLGFAPQGPRAAAVALSVALPAATPAFSLPADVEFEGTNTDGDTIAFRTLRAVRVSAAQLKAVQVDGGNGTLVDRTADYADGFAIQPFGLAPLPGAALYLGFDPLETGVPVSLGFRLGGPGNDAMERRRILDEAEAQAAACQPLRTRLGCAPDIVAPPLPLPPHHSVKLAWEAFTGAGWAALSPDDDTRSLTLDGFVELTLAASIIRSQQGTVAAPCFYLRCRILEGAYDAVPALLDIAVNAVAAEQAVPATQKFIIKAGATITGPAPAAGAATRFRFSLDARSAIVALDFGGTTGPVARVWSYTAPSATTDGEITLGLRFAGRGNGRPDQRAELRQAPVLNPELWTLTGAIWDRWLRRDDFDASTRVDLDFVLDAATGEIRFGSGERGRAPEAGALIVALYRETAAESGNLPRSAVGKVRQSPVNALLLSPLPPATRDQLAQMVANRAAADGGGAAESLEHAEGRAVEALHAHERLVDLAEEFSAATLDDVARERVRTLAAPSRGVNLLDLERIGLSVPGTRVARVRAWTSLDARHPCLDAPGVVTVVVVPEAPVGKPQPSEGLLGAVWLYLNRRRIVTTKVEVAGPQYVEIAVSASVRLQAGASAAKVSARIVAALAAFLDPLTGGPSSLGWPFGRSVYRTEILQLIDGVPGVDHVVTMSMEADSGPPQCGDIALCPMALVTSGAHKIEVL